MTTQTRFCLMDHVKCNQSLKSLLCRHYTISTKCKVSAAKDKCPLKEEACLKHEMKSSFKTMIVIHPESTKCVLSLKFNRVETSKSRWVKSSVWSCFHLKGFSFSIGAGGGDKKRGPFHLFAHSLHLSRHLAGIFFSFLFFFGSQTQMTLMFPVTMAA